jgi:hypothetical protein
MYCTGEFTARTRQGRRLALLQEEAGLVVAARPNWCWRRTGAMLASLLESIPRPPCLIEHRSRRRRRCRALLSHVLPRTLPAAFRFGQVN